MRIRGTLSNNSERSSLMSAFQFAYKFSREVFPFGRWHCLREDAPGNDVESFFFVVSQCNNKAHSENHGWIEGEMRAH
jgi:hypothetical protein